MSDKQQSPIQELQAWVERAKKATIKTDDKKVNVLILSMWTAVETKLEEALKEEKQLARDAYLVGEQHERAYWREDKVTRKETTFSNYYKKYGGRLYVEKGTRK